MSATPSFEADATDGRSGLVSRRDAVFGLSVAAVAGAFAYDSQQPSIEPLVFGFQPLPIDWLFAVSCLLLVCYGVWPLAADPDRVRRVWRGLRRRPPAVAALAWIALVFGLGTVGRVVVGGPEIRFFHGSQPPVFGSVSMDYITSCLGPVVDGRCRGTWQYPLGTTRAGRDVFDLVVSGSTVVVYVSVVTSTLVAPLATAAGTVAGYTDGRLAAAVERYVEVERVMLAIVVYLLLTAILGRSLLLFVAVYALFDWGGVASIVQTKVETLRGEGYVRFAETTGATDREVVRRHVVPNVAPVVVTAVTNRIPLLILAEATFAFLDLSDPEVASWGRVLSVGTGDILVLWWVAVVPVVVLLLTVLAFSTLGDAFQEVLDPQSR